MKKDIPPFTISVDNREKLPFKFKNSKTVFMETGDYGIIEAPNLITIDRKTLQDIVQTVTKNRERFENELERMQEFKFRAICIEATLEKLLQPYERSKAHPRSVVQSLLAFQVRFNVHVVFAGDRKHGAAVTLHLLEFAWKERCKSLGLI